MTHIDDWLDDELNVTSDVIVKVKEWFEHYRKPAAYKDWDYIHGNKLLCDYNGLRYRCIGCSRMGGSTA